MTSDPQQQNPDPSAEKPPMPTIKKMRWPFPVIWIVPLAAACLGAYFLYQQHQEKGVHITIQIEDASGFKPEQTALALHGVTIGHVRSIRVSDDHEHVTAEVELNSAEEFVARAGTIFWVVRPEVSLQMVSGLNTLISGPYIDCRPGDGPVAHEFSGLNSAPSIMGAGIRLILAADQIGQLSIDSPVSYRGVQVGQVKDVRLSSDATAVNVTIFVWERYQSLIRTNSQFWTLKGADLSGSLFGGVKLKLGSVQNLLSGGVGFATPETNYGEFVSDGAHFVLHDQARDEWLKWKSPIQLPPDTASGGDQKSAADALRKGSAMKGL